MKAEKSTLDLDVLSLGAGVQSTVMALMASEGKFGVVPDLAIFADTGWEPPEIYTHLDWLEKQLSFPVIRVQSGNLKADLIAKQNTTGQRFASVPFFTESGGMGRRQCTSEYKIAPILKEIRTQLGYKPKQHVKKSVRQWIGISLDEVERMKHPQQKWLRNYWPLVDSGMSRGDCFKWFQDRHPGRKLQKSACLGCPYRSHSEWAGMKRDSPEQFEDTCRIDDLIRTPANHTGLVQKQYISRTLKPLREVDFSCVLDQLSLNLFGNECEGMCGL